MYSKEKSWLPGPGKDVVMLWGKRSMKPFHSLQLPCHAAGETEAQTGIGANPNLRKKVSGRVRAQYTVAHWCQGVQITVMKNILEAVSLRLSP